MNFFHYRGKDLLINNMDVFQSKFNQYICDANTTVFFKLVKDLEDIDDEDGFFHPDMSHQIFGDKEQIFGYSDLRINVFYTASFLYTYVKITYSRKINPQACEGVEADNIMLKLKDVLTLPLCVNIDDFSILLQKENTFKPYGELIDTNVRDAGSSTTRIFEVFKADISNPQFRKYHERMESFILWFIDAASFIDVDDEKWDFYILFEKCTKNGSTSHYFVGYSTCYRFYAYPDKCRPRISQVLVLPPYQRQGHCSSLINAVYKQYMSRSDVKDITAEDPSENFQRVRDFVDAKNCSQLKEFCPPKLHGYFTKDMAEAAREKFKINKRQARRVYEILRLQCTNLNDDAEFTKYRLAIKSRINQPIKDQISRKQLQFITQNPSLLSSEDERRALLQREFESCVEEYQKVIARLNAT